MVRGGEERKGEGRRMKEKTDGESAPRLYM